MGQELIMGEEKQFFMLLADPIRFSGGVMCCNSLQEGLKVQSRP
jgi:hypothetical protein